MCILVLSGCATTTNHPSLDIGNKLPELIPVRDFVANRGSNFGYKLSPDGKKLAWIAIKGVSLHFFIKTLDGNSTHIIPAGNFYGGFEWAQDSRHLIYSLQRGDENTAYVTLDTEQVDDKSGPIFISPWGGVKAQLVSQIINDPEHVLISHNQRDRAVFDLFRVNIKTYKQELIAKNPGNVTEWVVNSHGELTGQIVNTSGKNVLEVYQSGKRSYRSIYHWESSDDVKIVSVSDDGGKIYILSNKGRDRKALVEIETLTGTENLVYSDPLVDVSNIYRHPVSGLPLLAFSDPNYPKVTLLNQSLSAIQSFMKAKAPGSFTVDSSDNQLHRMTISSFNDKGTEWYLYDIEHNQFEKLGSSSSLNHKAVLAEMSPIEITSRDNVTLRGYLTLPKNVAPRHLPMVLLVHGGPWDRDYWRYNSEVQFLANRGYVVLQINFRGSSGYGRLFQEMAIGEFAGKMQDDLIDGINWAIDKGIADPRAIAIMGGSYGGYASLVGLSFTPDRFACGIDIFGPTDLVRLVEDFPPYWKFEIDRWYRYVGNPSKAEDRVVMLSKSPLFKVGNINKPLMVIHGELDVRVQANQSITLVRKLKQQNKSVNFWLIPNAGHGVTHWPHRLKQFRKTEAFLADCLGGRSGGLDIFELGAWLF